MSTKIIAHVGTEKTGTSSIQKYLWSSRSELLEQNWLYLNALGPGPNIKLTACALDFESNSAVHKSLGITSDLQLKRHRAQMRKSIAEELDTYAPETILVSDEHLNVHLRQPDQLKKINNYFSDATVGKVVIYLRKQNRFLESIMSEGIKNQSILFTNDWKGVSPARIMQLDGKEIPYRFDYQSILSNLGLAFPDAELIVRGYPDDGGSFDSVTDFTNAIELPVSTVIDSSVRENRSIPGRIFPALVELGHYAKHDEEPSITRQWRKVVEIASQAFPSRSFRLESKDSIAVMERFAQQNEKLARQYPSLETVFFNNNVKESDSHLDTAVDSLEVMEILKEKAPESLKPGLLRIESKLKARRFASRNKTIKPSQIQKVEEKAMKTDKIHATCPICAGSYAVELSKELREGPLCPHCNASGRASAIVYHVCDIAFGNNTPLVNQSEKKSFSVVGLSDGPRYASLLDDKFNYVNTFYHKEPFLDITAPCDNHAAQYDLIISTEVFEHVVGDPLAPFKGALSVLKPGGTMILTVPFRNKGEHMEHYPGLKSYTSREISEAKWIADLEFSDGTTTTDENPKFHGGPGKTLEVRLYNRTQLLKDLSDSGFSEIEIHDENKPQFGINWGPASRVITAKRPLKNIVNEPNTTVENDYGEMLANVR